MSTTIVLVNASGLVIQTWMNTTKVAVTAERETDVNLYEVASNIGNGCQLTNGVFVVVEAVKRAAV